MPASKKLPIGIAQLLQCPDIGHNLRRISHVMEHAAEAKIDLLVFPECALTGYAPVHHRNSRSGFDPDAVEAALYDLRQQARRLKQAILIGTHLPKNTGWTNSLLLIRADGRVAARYDKAHLFKDDPDFYLPGDVEPKPVSFMGVRCGLQICFDLRFPEPFRLLALQNAQLIFVPSLIHGEADMWKRPIIEAAVRTRASENGRFVIFANAAGKFQNCPSIVADPAGRVIAEAEQLHEELLIATLDIGLVNNNFISQRRWGVLPPSPKGNRR